jgi:hypothetical protein
MKRMILCGLMMAAATVAQVEAKTFDVTDYGAKGDDKTDNTEAFTACMKAIVEAGGGRMYIPNGVYRGRIIVPGTKEWITNCISLFAEFFHYHLHYFFRALGCIGFGCILIFYKHLFGFKK